MSKKKILYFFDMVYSESCQDGYSVIPFQIQARVHILADDLEDAKNRISLYLNRPIDQFFYVVKVIEEDVVPDPIEPGLPWYS